MNLDYIEQIVAVLAEFPVSEITLEQNGQRIQARRPLTQVTAQAPAAQTAADVEAAETPPAPAAQPPRTLLAPMVGIFHHPKVPLSFDAAVRVGQVIGYIESMKLMNEVLAEDAGQVTDVLAEDGAPVEYGQPLFRLAA